MFEGIKLPIINGTYLLVSTAQFDVYTEDANNLMKLKFTEKIKMESCPETFTLPYWVYLLEGIKSIISAKCQVTVQHIQ